MRRRALWIIFFVRCAIAAVWPWMHALTYAFWKCRVEPRVGAFIAVGSGAVGGVGSRSTRRGSSSSILMSGSGGLMSGGAARRLARRGCCGACTSVRGCRGARRWCRRVSSRTRARRACRAARRTGSCALASSLRHCLRSFAPDGHGLRDVSVVVRACSWRDGWLRASSRRGGGCGDLGGEQASGGANGLQPPV